MINIFKASLGLTSALTVLSITVCGPAFADTKLQEEKELEVVDFKSIKKVLKEDGLTGAVDEKKMQVKALKKVQKTAEQSRTFYPGEDELWGFISEYWLVKNAQLLKWDFTKPDYGLDASFKSLLEKLGFYQKRFKILLLDTPGLVRTTLPGPKGEPIYLISVPFMRALDLSKLEISLLLLEDYFRQEAGYFKKNVATEKLKKLAGTNFQGAKPDLSMVEEVLKKYDNQVKNKGYTFQEQFEVTKKMDAYLKGTPELWNSYFRMLGKINQFVKGNAQYKEYVRLFPSPEMQQKWLSPEEKVL